MVVVITSTGGVTKRVLHVRRRPSIPGSRRGPAPTSTSAWQGVGLGRAHAARRGSPIRRWAPASAPSSSAWRPSSPSWPTRAEDTLYVDGAARLLAEHRFQDLTADQRADEACSSAAWRCSACCAPRSASATCSCASATRTSCRRCTRSPLVAAGYGLPARNLGTVSVIGPVRMDYAAGDPHRARGRPPALALHRGRLRGRLMAEHPPPRSLRGPRRRPRRRRRPQIKKAFRRLARELHPDVNRHDPDAEEKFKEAAEAYEILSDAERRATYDRYGHDGLRSGGFAPELRGLRLDLRPLRRVLRRRERVRRRDARRPGAGRRRRGQRRGDARAGGDAAPRSSSASRPSTPASAATATAPSRARRSSPASAAAAPACCRRSRARPSGRSCARSPATSAAATGAIARAALRALRGPRARGAPAHAARRRPGGDRRRPAHPPRPAAATPASAAGRPATSTCSST